MKKVIILGQGTTGKKLAEQCAIQNVVGSASDKCTKCPECRCEKYVHKDELGAGYRICTNCTQEWWTDINYDS